MLSSQAELLGNPGDAERLTRKSGAEDIVLRGVGYCPRVNVAVRLLAEIRLVRSLLLLVPIGRPNAFASSALKGNSEAANSTKELDKSTSALGNSPVRAVRKR